MSDQMDHEQQKEQLKLVYFAHKKPQVQAPAIPTMSMVHNATEHAYVTEQSKGCSVAIFMGLSA